MSSNYDDLQQPAHTDPAAGHGDSDPDPHAGEHDAPTTVEATKRPALAVLIWPLIILLIVLLAILPNVVGAFSRYPASTISQTTTSTGQDQTPVPGTILVAVPSVTLPAPGTQTSGGLANGTVIPQATQALPGEPTNVTAPLTGTAVLPTETTAPPPTDTTVPPTDTVAPPTNTVVPATPTTAAVLPPGITDAQQGAVLGLVFAGKTFRVEPTEIVQDWKFTDQPDVANWISGTTFNKIVGLPYNTTNATLFKNAKPNDPIQVTITSGDVLTFAVAQVQRVPTTDTAVMAQDHPGVTLLLLGEPTDDRAVVMGAYKAQALTP
jgi:hypothetical protein